MKLHTWAYERHRGGGHIEVSCGVMGDRYVAVQARTRYRLLRREKAMSRNDARQATLGWLVILGFKVTAS